MTDNDCYKTNRKITPKGIMIHSTASPGVMAADWFERWNKPGVNKCVHAFVDNNETWQYLPWNHRGWHAGAPDEGGTSANSTHIGIEMCEPHGHSYNGGYQMIGYDATLQDSYFRSVWQNTVSLCVSLCIQFELNETHIIDHSAGHQLGIASNHADVMHWFPHHGESMETFRAAVKEALLNQKWEKEIEEHAEPIEDQDESDLLYAGSPFSQDVQIGPNTSLIYEDIKNISLDTLEEISKDNFRWVYDGDTIAVDSFVKENTGEYDSTWIRLVGVDAPEMPNVHKDTPAEVGARQSKKFLENLIDSFDYQLVIEWSSNPSYDQDLYGRSLGVLYLKHGDKYINVNKTMLANQHAKFFPFLGKEIDVSGRSIAKFNHHDILSWGTYKVDAPPVVNEDLQLAFDNLIKSRQNYDNRDQILGTLSPYGIRIGDVQTSIPPIAIKVTRQGLVEKVPTLRQKGTLKSKTGKYETIIELELFFSGAQELNGTPIHQEKILQVDSQYKETKSGDQMIEEAANLSANDVTFRTIDLDQPYYINGLRPLIAQFKRSPFVPIQNKTLNEEFNITAVGLVGMSIATLEGFPNTVRVNLRLVDFDIGTYIPEAIEMADYVIWPLYRWYYQRSMRRPQGLGDYLSPIDGDKLVGNFMFGYVPTELGDDFEFLEPGSHNPQSERASSYRTWSTIHRIRSESKAPEKEYEKEYWDLHMIRQGLMQYNSPQTSWNSNVSSQLKNRVFYYSNLRADSLYFGEGFLFPLLSEKYRAWGHALNHKKDTPRNTITKNFTYIDDNDVFFVTMDRLDNMMTANLEHENYVRSLEEQMNLSESDLPINEFPIEGLTLLSLRTGLENMITTIEADGKPVPINQFLGSQDSIIQATFRATNDIALRKFEELYKYSMHVSQNPDSYTSNLLPGFLHFDAELTRLMGINHVLIERVDYSNVPNQPGSFDIIVSMVDFQRSQRDSLEWDFISGVPDNNNINELTSFEHGSDLNQLQILNQLNTVSMYPDMDLPFNDEVRIALVNLHLGITDVVASGTLYAEPDFYMLPSKSQADMLMSMLSKSSLDVLESNTEGLTEEQIDELHRQDDKLKFLLGSPINLQEAYKTKLPPEMQDAFSMEKGDSKGFYHDFLRYDKRGRLARAFPTLQFLIMDEGQVIGMRKLFDNLYGIKGILDVSVHKAKNIAADTAILAFNDPFNRFGGSDRMMGPPLDYAQNLDANRVWRQLEIRESIMKERSRDRFKLHLQTGARVHLRLGYGSNIENFPILFNGTITEMELGEIIQIVAQSDAIEIVNQYVEDEKFVTGQRADDGIQPQNWIVGALSSRNGRIKEYIRRSTWGRYQHGGGISHFGRANYPKGWSILENKLEQTTNEEDRMIANEFQRKIRESIMKLEILHENLAKERENYYKNYPRPHSDAIQYRITEIGIAIEDIVKAIVKLAEMNRNKNTGFYTYMLDSVSELSRFLDESTDLDEITRTLNSLQTNEFNETDLSSIEFWIENARQLGTWTHHGGWFAGELGDNIWKSNGMMNFRESAENKAEAFWRGLTLTNDYKEDRVRIRSAGKNVWDVVQGLTYSSADYIAAAHPFGLRSSLFHGRPHWLFAYEYDPEYIKQGRAGVDRRLSQMNKNDAKAWTDVFRPIVGSANQMNVLEEADRKRHLRYKPYMQFHFYDSQSDIVINNIKSTSMNVFTETHAQYASVGTEQKIMKVWADKDIIPDDIRIQHVRTDLTSKFGGSILPKTLELISSFIGIPGTDANLAGLIGSATLAKPVFNFACNAQADSLRNMYQGTVTVLGDPSLKPHDMINLQDDHNNMRGPCTIRSVTHSMSFQEGFITVFEPEPCVSVEDETLAMLPEVVQTVGNMMWSISGTVIAYALVSKLIAMSIQKFVNSAAYLAVQGSQRLIDMKMAVGAFFAKAKTSLMAIPIVASKGPVIAAFLGTITGGAATIFSVPAVIVGSIIIAFAALGIVIYKGITSWLERMIKSQQACTMTLMTWRDEPFYAGIRGHSGLVYGDRPKIAPSGIFSQQAILSWLGNALNIPSNKNYYDGPLAEQRDNHYDIIFYEDSDRENIIDTQQKHNQNPPFISTSAEQQVTIGRYAKLDIENLTGLGPYIQPIEDSVIYDIYKNLLSKLGLSYEDPTYGIVHGYINDTMIPSSNRLTKPAHAWEAHTYGRAIEFKFPLGRPVIVNGEVVEQKDLLVKLLEAANTLGVNSMGYDFNKETFHIDIMLNSNRSRPFWHRNAPGTSFISVQDFMSTQDLLRSIVI